MTVADHEAEVLLTEALHAAHPDAVVLGEEAFAGDPTLLERYVAAEHSFTVDPVDGTKNFVHGSPDHAVMVSESRAGEVVRAWIYQPQHRLAYVAERGAGAFRNGERLTRSAPSPDPASWRGVTSRRAWIGRELPGLRPLELTWVCCGVDYPKLVEGAADFVLYGAGLPVGPRPGVVAARRGRRVPRRHRRGGLRPGRRPDRGPGRGGRPRDVRRGRRAPLTTGCQPDLDAKAVSRES